MMATIGVAATSAAAQSPIPSLFRWWSPATASPPLFTPRTPVEGSDEPLAYRTVCVRLCDGYYFPVSASSQRARFHRDDDLCRNSCESGARLFYHPIGKDIDHAVDLEGQAYTRLPNAFRYRKALKPGCACRPEPWSDTARERHDRYASVEPRATAEGPDTAPASSPDPIHDTAMPPAMAILARPPRVQLRDVQRPARSTMTRVVVAPGVIAVQGPVRTYGVTPARGLFGGY